MKTSAKITLAAALFLAPAAALAGSEKAVGQLDTSWGDLTKDSATTDGRDHGDHAADPSGDGPGNEDRSGLANVLEQGNLAATTTFIDGIVNP